MQFHKDGFQGRSYWRLATAEESAAEEESNPNPPETPKDGKDGNHACTGKTVTFGEEPDTNNSKDGPEPYTYKTAKSATFEAEAWLRDALASGPRPADAVRDAARTAGFDRDAVNAARLALRVRTDDIGGVHHWTLPAGDGPAEGNEAA